MLFLHYKMEEQDEAKIGLQRVMGGISHSNQEVGRLLKCVDVTCALRSMRDTEG